MTAKAAHELALAAKQEPTWYECINSIGCPHAFTCSLCSCMLTDTHTPSTFVYVSVSHTQASHTHKIVKRTKFACLLCALKKKKKTTSMVSSSEVAFSCLWHIKQYLLYIRPSLHTVPKHFMRSPKITGHLQSPWDTFMMLAWPFPQA